MNAIMAQQLITDAIDITHDLPLAIGDLVVTHASPQICKLMAINGTVATIQEHIKGIPFDVHITSIGSFAIWQLLASFKTESTVLLAMMQHCEAEYQAVIKQQYNVDLNQ